VKGYHFFFVADVDEPPKLTFLITFSSLLRGSSLELCFPRLKRFLP
jgi:hypothetical protein